MFTGTGHWLHVDRPGEFNRILDDVIWRVERRSLARASLPVRVKLNTYGIIA
jgi:hypothetical protein